MSSGRYVAIPFEAKRTNLWGNEEDLIRLEKEGQPFDCSRYNQYTTHAGYTIKWAEVPIEELEALDSNISWNFNSDVCGYVGFSGTGKQAITFFRSLKTLWLLELVPEDSFIVNA